MKKISTLGIAVLSAAALLLFASCSSDNGKISGYQTVIPADAIAVVSVDANSLLDKVDIKSLGSPVSASVVKTMAAEVGVDLGSRAYLFVQELNPRDLDNPEVYALAKVSDKSKVKEGLRLLSDDVDIVSEDGYNWVKVEGDIQGVYNDQFVLLSVQPTTKKSLRKIIDAKHLSNTDSGKKYFKYGGEINAYLNAESLYSFVEEYSSEDIDFSEYKDIRGYAAVDFNDGNITVRGNSTGVDKKDIPCRNIDPEAFSYLPKRDLVAAFGMGISGEKIMDLIKEAGMEDDVRESLRELRRYVDINDVNGTFALGFNGLNFFNDPIATVVIPARVKNIDDIENEEFEAGYAGEYTYLTSDNRFSKKGRDFEAADFEKAAKGIVYGYLDFDGLMGMLQSNRSSREVAANLEPLSSVIDCMTLTSKGVDEATFVIYMKGKGNSLDQLIKACVEIAQNQSYSNYGYGFDYDDDNDWMMYEEPEDVPNDVDDWDW